MMRFWTVDDLEEISAIEHQCFSDPWSRSMLYSAFSSANFTGILCEENGVIIGYAGGTCVLDEGNLDLVAVKKEYRNKGVATNLITTLHKTLKEKGATTVYLEVRRSNENAIRLYEKLGYIAFGERKNYYGTEDAILYRISL